MNVKTKNITQTETPLDPDPVQKTTDTASNSSKPKQVQTKFFKKSEPVEKVEILIAMKSVVSHISRSSLDDFAQLCKVMFTDKTIASDLCLGGTKIGYVVNFSLGPYYKDKVMKTLVPENAVCPKFVSCFVESVNNVSTKKQLDVHIILFDENARQIKINYIGSEYIGPEDAETVVKAFKSVHGKLDYVHNLAHISMTGPNVNWKIVEMLKQYHKEEDPLSSMLLEFGSCGLHVLHGAYQTAQFKTDWNLDKVLNCYSIFKKFPSKRSDYLETNDLQESHEGKSSAYLFPLEYCGLRCLENGKVIKQFIDIQPYLKQYFEYLAKNK